MKNNVIAEAIFVAIAFAVAGMFLFVALQMIGDSQDGVIQHSKKIESY
jgi:hypothetical protein